MAHHTITPGDSSTVFGTIEQKGSLTGTDINLWLSLGTPMGILSNIPKHSIITDSSKLIVKVANTMPTAKPLARVFISGTKNTDFNDHDYEETGSKLIGQASISGGGYNASEGSVTWNKTWENNLSVFLNTSGAEVGKCHLGSSPHIRLHNDYSSWTKEYWCMQAYIYLQYNTPHVVVKTSVNDSNRGSVSGANTYDYNATNIVIQATPKAGYYLSSWSGAASGNNTTLKYAASDLIDAYDAEKTFTANFSPQTYTVSFDSMGGSSVNSIQATFNSTYSNLSSVNSPTKDGYEFKGWYTQPNGAGTKVESTTKVTATSNHTLYAYWVGRKYTVSYNGNGSTSGSASSTTHTYGTSSNLSSGGNLERKYKVTYQYKDNITSDSEVWVSYSLLGWSKTSNATSAQFALGKSVSTDFLPSKDNDSISLYATWKKNSTVLPNPTRKGYDFSGWYNSSGSKIGDGGKDYEPTGNITLIAHWTARKYTITLNGNGGSSPSSVQVTFDQQYGNFGSSTKNGFEFKGWYTSPYWDTGEEIKPTTIVDKDYDQTFYARWKALEDINYNNLFSLSSWFNSKSSIASSHTVDYNNIEGSIKLIESNGATDRYTTMSATDKDNTLYVIPVQQKENNNDVVYIFSCELETNGSGRVMIFNTNSSNNGYVGSSFPLDLDNMTSGTYKQEFTVSGEKIHIRFGTRAANCYTKFSNIRIYKKSIDNNVALTSKSRDLKTLSSLLVPEKKEGYSFYGWHIDEKLNDNQVTLEWAQSLTQGTTVYSKILPNKYKIIYDGNGYTGYINENNKVNEKTYTYDKQDNLSPNIYKREYGVTYTLIDESDSNKEEDKASCPIQNDIAYYTFANKWMDKDGKTYVDQQLIFNLSSTNNDIITLYAQWNSGSVILPEPTRKGYTFSGWYKKDGTYIGINGDEFIPNSNTELIAHWEEHTYTITFNGNSGNGSMYSIVANYSQKITLPQIGFTKLGYHFTGWITADNGPDEPYKSGNIVSRLTAINNDTIEFVTTWAPNKYKIEFVKKEDYSGDMDILDITYDDPNDYFPPNKFSKKGYIFQGWSTSSLGNKIDYEVGDEIPNLSTTENSTVYIYAVWKTIVYSIVFDGNGSTSGEMNDIIDPVSYDEEIQLPDVRYEKFGYDFIGWLSSEGGEIIKQNTIKNLTDKNEHRVTLYAQWKQKKYTIIWEDVADGENRTTEEYSNTIPQYSTTPWKSYTDEMHFIFVDWDRPIELLGNEEDGAIIRYKAIFNSEKHEHTQTDVIDPIGANPGYTRHTCPLEECGHYYDDTTTWRVIFLEYDETELSNEILNEFEEIFPPSSYIPIETSMDTAEKDYYFNGWTKKPGYGYDDGNYIGNSNSEKWMEGANARSNLVYQATYDYHIKTYPVSWYDGDGKLVYYQANVPYGEVPTQPSIIPTKTSTSTEVFSFEYWKLEGTSEDGIIQVQGPQNYYAQFSSGVRTYTVIWKNPGVEEPLYIETGIKFQEKVPKYEGDPAKLVHPNEGDPLYTYEFVGWSTEIIDHIPEDSEQDFPDDGELPLVTGDVIYTAVYKKKYQIYNIRARILYQDDEIWINYEDSYYSDEIYLNAYFYGKPAGYTFLQWDDGNKNIIRKIIVKEDKDYKAEYIPNYYTVKWVGYKNNTLKTEQLPYKTKPDSTEVEQMNELKKPYDDKYHYEFDSWEIMRGNVNEKGEILGDVIYRAVYKTKEHQWSATEFNFVIDEGYAEAKRYCTCENCNEWEEHYDRAVVTLTSRVLKGEEVSCDKDGYLTYFASFKDDWNGLVTKKVVIKQTGHLWSDTQRIGKNYDEKGWHYKVCLRCNQAEAGTHNWDEGKVDNSNACIDGGVMKFKCQDKGCDGVYHIGMSPGEHKDFISTPGREPTCEENGNKPYKQCTVCKLYYPEEADANKTSGKFSNSSFIIKALGHAYNKIVHTIVDENTGEVIDTRADCTNSGVVRQICDHGCGIDRIINISPRKHNWGEVMVDRESTCTENGVGICQCKNTETDYHKKCEDIKSVKLPLKPHTPNIIESGIPPTCTEKGESDKIICSVCLKILQDAYEIPALGHHFISKSLIPEENTLRREVLNVCTRKGCNHRYGLYFSD